MFELTTRYNGQLQHKLELHSSESNKRKYSPFAFVFPKINSAIIADVLSPDISS